MILHKLTLRHFRNVPLASLQLGGLRQFFVGANGQGKSNLLEAAGCVTALRSFRTPDSRHLIMQGEAEAGISCVVEREGEPAVNVVIKVGTQGKELWYDQARVSRLADHIGRFPTVVFSSHDLQLVRGAPALRRRWLDLTLSAMDPKYLAALQTYTRALAERNALLRRPGAAGAAQLDAFDKILAPAALSIVALRTSGVEEISRDFDKAYGRLCGQSEGAHLSYVARTLGDSEEAMLSAFASARARDLQAQTTTLGPHRDDLDFSIRGGAARDFASEGQQRSAMIALRLAQADWFQRKSGVRPVLLADDILGELDPARRERFWASLDPQCQVIATGTDRPQREPGDWQVFTVAAGTFTPESGPMGGTT